jgi:hypothetical protein
MAPEAPLGRGTLIDPGTSLFDDDFASSGDFEFDLHGEGGIASI